MIYLVIGNHQTLSGVWEQIEITLRTFKEMNVRINVSSRIKAGHVNILIEDFNSYIIEDLIGIKAKNPDTQYILLPTEYCSQSLIGTVTLNCFSTKTRIIRWIFHWEYRLCGDAYHLYRGGNWVISVRSKLRRLFSPILQFCAELAGSTYSNEIMMARRETCLDRVKDLFTLCIGTSEAVLKGYNDYCGCPIQYLPAFVDKNRMHANRSKAQKTSSIIFSGRMTPYRNTICDEIGIELLNSYPLEAGEAWNKDKQLKDTEFKIRRLERDTTTLGQKQAITFAREIKEAETPSFQVLSSGIYEYTSRSKSAAYEIYIPQAASWPYSSPNRTILSIECGLIPLDYGEFSDHDINMVAIKAADNNAIKGILGLDLNQCYRELDDRVDKYNEGQRLKIPDTKAVLLRLCDGDPGTWDDVDLSPLGGKLA